MKEGKVVA
jgi:hypothetical protein